MRRAYVAETLFTVGKSKTVSIDPSPNRKAISEMGFLNTLTASVEGVLEDLNSAIDANDEIAVNAIVSWLVKDDHFENPFSFTNCCKGAGYDPELLINGTMHIVRKWKEVVKNEQC